MDRTGLARLDEGTNRRLQRIGYREQRKPFAAFASVSLLVLACYLPCSLSPVTCSPPLRPTDCKLFFPIDCKLLICLFEKNHRATDKACFLQPSRDSTGTCLKYQKGMAMDTCDQLWRASSTNSPSAGGRFARLGSRRLKVSKVCAKCASSAG